MVDTEIPIQKRLFERGVVRFGPVLKKGGGHIEKPVAIAAIVEVDEVKIGAVDHDVFTNEVGVDQADVEVERGKCPCRLLTKIQQHRAGGNV